MAMPTNEPMKDERRIAKRLGGGGSGEEILVGSYRWPFIRPR